MPMNLLIMHLVYKHLIDLNYMSSRLIFLYNCDSEQKKLVVKNLTSFVLPNHKIPLEDEKKAKKNNSK